MSLLLARGSSLMCVCVYRRKRILGETYRKRNEFSGLVTLSSIIDSKKSMKNEIVLRMKIVCRNPTANRWQHVLQDLITMLFISRILDRIDITIFHVTDS